MKIVNYEKKYFSGYVVLFDKKIFIDLNDGTGVNEVFKLMEPLINKLSIYYNSKDIKQELCIYFLEGMLRYNEKENMSLSSYLYLFIRNRNIDMLKKKRIETVSIEVLNIINSRNIDPEKRIDCIKRTSIWSNRWKEIIFRIFINGDKILDVANDENMTPWGLTRGIRNRLKEAKNV